LIVAGPAASLGHRDYLAAAVVRRVRVAAGRASELSAWLLGVRPSKSALIELGTGRRREGDGQKPSPPDAHHQILVLNATMPPPKERRSPR